MTSTTPKPEDLSTTDQPGVDNLASMKWSRLLRAHIMPASYRLEDLCLSGSRAYGMAQPESDYDLRGMHLIPLDDLLGLEATQQTIERTFTYNGTMSIDLVSHDLGKICRLLLKHNGSILEQVCGEPRVLSATWHEELVALAKKTITVGGAARAYRGFARAAWATCKAKGSIKYLLHLYRILYTAIHLLRTGEVEVNLARLNADFGLPMVADLLNRRAEGEDQGVLDQVDLAVHEQAYRNLLGLLQEAADTSALPLSLDEGVEAEMSAFLVRVRKGPGPGAQVCKFGNSVSENRINR